MSLRTMFDKLRELYGTEDAWRHALSACCAFGVPLQLAHISIKDCREAVDTMWDLRNLEAYLQASDDGWLDPRQLGSVSWLLYGGAQPSWHDARPIERPTPHPRRSLDLRSMIRSLMRRRG